AVIDEAHDHDQAPGQQQAPGHVRVREHAVQGGQLARHHQRGGQPRVHGEPPEQRGGHHVDVPVAGGVHRADRDSESPHERRQHIGDGCGHEQGQNVFTHRLTTAQLGLRASRSTLGHPGPGRVHVVTPLVITGRLSPVSIPARPGGSRPAVPYSAAAPPGDAPPSGARSSGARSSGARSSAAPLAAVAPDAAPPAIAPSSAAPSATAPSDAAPSAAAPPSSSIHSSSTARVTTSRRRATEITPGRSSLGTTPVRSTIVAGPSAEQGPPSRYTATASPSWASASTAV